MKKIVFALCALAVVTSCTFSFNTGGKKVYCKGPVIEKTFDELIGFNAITLNGSTELVISQAEATSVTVKANEEAFEHLNFRVVDGNLLLENKNNVQIVAKTFKVYISLPTLETVLVNGAAEGELNNYHSDKDLTVIVNGAGDFEISHISVPSLSFTINGAGDLDATSMRVGDLTVSVHGAGDVTLSGKAGHASLNVAGAGDIDATELECERVETSKSGMAVISTHKKD